MDYIDYIEQQQAKSNAMSTDLKLKINDFYSKCKTKLNYGSCEIVSNKLLILKEQYSNLKIFFEENIQEEIIQLGYCDEDL